MHQKGQQERVIEGLIQICSEDFKEKMIMLKKKTARRFFSNFIIDVLQQVNPVKKEEALARGEQCVFLFFDSD